MSGHRRQRKAGNHRDTAPPAGEPCGEPRGGALTRSARAWYGCLVTNASSRAEPGRLDRESVLARARAVRAQLATTAAEVDRAGRLPVAGLGLVHGAGFSRLLVPREYGGDATRASITSDLELLTEVLTELSAGESSTAQIWFVQTLVVRAVFGGLCEVDEGTKRELARELLEEDARIGNAAAEAGRLRRDFKTLGRRVEGGVVLDGFKLFSTGAEGARYVFTPYLQEGFETVQDGGLAFALVPQGAEGMKLHGDWDNMGQRATESGAITFEGCFVPERLLCPIRGGGKRFFSESNIFGPFMHMTLNAVILGMGSGALAALLPYVREHSRPNTPGLERAADDPLTRWHTGRISALLAGARALAREASRLVEAAENGEAERGEASIHMMRARYTTYEAVLAATGELHRLTGARATASRFDFDRFWRNARTLTVHDSIDWRLQEIGRFELDGVPPPPSFLS